ncbi:MAG: twin-arginine translocation signal domain-containing protein, partial [Terracidiphilus sp.]
MSSSAAKGEVAGRTNPTRREVLQALGASSALALAGTTPAVATPPQAEAGT